MQYKLVCKWKKHGSYNTDEVIRSDRCAIMVVLNDRINTHKNAITHKKAKICISGNKVIVSGKNMRDGGIVEEYTLHEIIEKEEFIFTKDIESLIRESEGNV